MLEYSVPPSHRWAKEICKLGKNRNTLHNRMFTCIGQLLLEGSSKRVLESKHY